MRVKRIMWALFYTVMGVIAAYTGISAVTAWHKAATQPTLAAGAEVYRFAGYRMMAAGYLAFSLAALLAIAIPLVLKLRKAKEKRV